ncbi:cell division protein ZapA [Paraliobacillus ryukyuensis]|uniref:Cell division protein ZapA n=1 Tax=Paraliobacillus ryukyuensis TaxID=200904 RepID=A0A366EAV0_9BACI|nr:cell division protein ZapA [Paraliobacillus ryukyuensis]RBO99447.1 cell division protein ZapA [Paraliobacillus ryukyuensis]
MSRSDKTRITVDIYGKTYTIIGEENAHHVKLVASLVDEKMREIHDVNKSLDTSRLAVLTAVNTMNDYLKLQQEFDKLKNSIKQKEEKEDHD